jgi:hypothetical protein
MINITEDQLKCLLEKSYRAGWHGVLELCQSNVQEIISEFKQKKREDASLFSRYPWPVEVSWNTSYWDRESLANFLGESSGGSSMDQNR